MAMIKVHTGLSAQQLKLLDKIGQKLLLDRTNTIRLAISRLAEQENIK